VLPLSLLLRVSSRLGRIEGVATVVVLGSMVHEMGLSHRKVSSVGYEEEKSGQDVVEIRSDPLKWFVWFPFFSR